MRREALCLAGTIVFLFRCASGFGLLLPMRGALQLQEEGLSMRHSRLRIEVQGQALC